MRILFLLLILTVFVKAQIFTDSFPSFPFDSTTGVSGWILWEGNDTRDMIGSNNLTPNGFSTDRADELTAGSILYQGEDCIQFNGTSEYYTGSTTDIFNANTSDIAFLAWFTMPASISTPRDVFSKLGSGQGWFINTNTGPTTGGAFWSGGTQPLPSVSVEVNSTYFVAVTCDRDANMIIYVFGGDTFLSDTASIASINFNNSNAAPLTIGKYAGGASAFFTGKIHAAKFYKGVGSVLSVADIKRQAFLPAGWTSDNGNVARYNWGWHLGILEGTILSASSVVIKLKGKNDKYNVMALTGDSTRYSFQFEATSLSGDSIVFVTSQDSAWHALPDTILPAGYVVGGTVALWQENFYGGKYTIIDNLTIQGVEQDQPEATATTSGKFKGNSAYNKFKGW